MLIGRAAGLGALAVICAALFLAILPAEIQAQATVEKKVESKPQAADGQRRVTARWAIVYSPDGQTAAVASGMRKSHNTGEISLREVTTGREVALVKRDLGVRSVAFSADGKLLAFGDFDGFSGLVDPAAGKLLHTFPQRPKPVYAVAFAPDGKLLAAACLDGTLTLWNVEQQTEHTTLNLTDPVTAVAISLDGRTLAAATWQGKVQLWDLPSLQPKHTLEGSVAPQAAMRIVEAIAFSNDSKQLVTGSWDTTMRLWDVEKGTIVREFTGVEWSINSIAFAPDGKTIATGESRPEAGIRFWDPAHSQWKWQLGAYSNTERHTFRVFGLAFSPDSRRLASASWDGSARVWDLESRKHAVLLIPRNDFNGARVNPPPTPVPVPVAVEVRREFKIRVMDSQKEPVAGAKVSLKSFTLASRRNGLFPDGLIGPITSDAQGIAQIVIPEKSDTPELQRLQEAVKGGIKTIEMQIEHPQHPAVRLPVDVDIARIELPDEAVLEIRAHREGETQPIGNLQLLFNPMWTPAFSSRSERDGVLVLHGVDLKSERSVRWLRVAHFPEQGPALFSELKDLSQGEGNPQKLEYTLRPGVRVEGRLPDQVPRPVKNGKVVGVLVRSEGNNVAKRWWVNLAAEIAPDGTFVFESLPAGEMLQMLAVCDGWTSLPATLEEITAYATEHGFKFSRYPEMTRMTVLPQLQRLEGKVVQPVLAMERNVSCEVRVVEEDGRPVADARVTFNLSHQFYNHGGNVLGRGVNGLDPRQIQMMNGEIPFPVAEVPPNPYSQTTNAAGVVAFSNLPVGRGPMDFRFTVNRDRPASEAANAGTTAYAPAPASDPRTVTIFPGTAGSVTVRFPPMPPKNSP